jgi:hypothetical protein
MSRTVQFDPLAAGVATISLTPPPGFSTPSDRQQITATVTAPNISIGNATVGRDLQTSVGITLTAAPPSPVTVTVTSNAGSIATITRDHTLEGGTTLTFTNVTTTSVGTIFVQGRAQGSTTLTVQAPGYNDGTSNVVVDPSGFYLNASSFTTTASSANTTVTVTAARLNPTTLNVALGQELRGGLSNVNVAVTSSAPTVGTIVNSPAVFNGGDMSRTVQFDPIAAGAATISLGTTPPGFSTPSDRQQITATVNP